MSVSNLVSLTFRTEPRFLMNGSFCMFVNKHFTHLRLHITNSKRCYNMKTQAYYYVKTKTSEKLHICVSVPLNATRVQTKKIPFFVEQWKLHGLPHFFRCRGYRLRKKYLWWEQTVALLFIIVTHVLYIRISLESGSISSNEWIPTVSE